jgi:hypothetical protein
MRFSTKMLLVVCGVGSFAMVGCKGTAASPSAPEATTMPMPETNMRSPGPTTMSVAPAAPQPMAAAPAAKDMTHSVEKDQPYFTTEPTASATPAGTLMAGAKVLVIIPGAPYSQVLTEKGINAYTATDGLKPLGK